MKAKSTKIPKIRTFKMTACEVTDKINSILKSNSESKVLIVEQLGPLGQLLLMMR